jgi:hypothetical protein
VAVDPSIADQEDSNGDQVRARTHAAAASGRVGDMDDDYADRDQQDADDVEVES